MDMFLQFTNNMIMKQYDNLTTCLLFFHQLYINGHNILQEICC